MIELKQAEKLYGRKGKPGRRGLQATSLSIPDGQVVGLLGENGAGKSTLLRAVAGLNPLTGGSICIDGRRPEQCYGELAFITGEGSFFPEMSPALYGSFLAEYFPKFDMHRYRRLLEFFQISSDQPIKKMSTGQRSKVEVAAGVSKRAKYLLMDEPFLGKDIFTRRDFLKLIASSIHGEETILITTHHVDEIEPFLDRAIIMHQGRVSVDMLLEEVQASGGSLMELMQKGTGYDAQRYQQLLEDLEEEET